MFLGYQNEKIVLVADTREELENNKFMKFDAIVESDTDYVLYNGEYITLTQAEERTQADEKRAQIKSLQEQLDVLDLKEIRPLGAKATGVATEEDEERLAEYERQKQEIRKQIRDLQGE